MVTDTLVRHPIYDIHKSYAENLEKGPFFNEALPQRTWLPENTWIDFMGFKVAAPLGVPAGPLLGSRWIRLATALGFDVVTYKTIRSHAYPSHPLPNVIYVKPHPHDPQLAIEINVSSEKNKELSITNSFGMPSMSPDYLQKDIAEAKRSIQRGQVLIVSVVGTPGYSSNLAEDFCQAAVMAKEAGADIIEANFSCPNVSSKEGCLYSDPEHSFQIASTLVKALKSTPLLIKVGKYSHFHLCREVLLALARANVQGVCGLNSVSKRVVKSDGTPALGGDRKTSGICGDMIRSDAIQFIHDAHTIISQEKLDLEVVGCGGITKPQHFDDFLAAGAKIAMTATGMMWDPYLAIKWLDSKLK